MRDWRSLGDFPAFIVALFAEMYGFLGAYTCSPDSPRDIIQESRRECVRRDVWPRLQLYVPHHASSRRAGGLRSVLDEAMRTIDVRIELEAIAAGLFAVLAHSEPSSS